MFIIVFFLGIALLWLLTRGWFWKLAGSAAGIVFLLTFAGGHARLIGYGMDLAVVAGAGYGIWKAAVWVKDRKTIRELPAETTSYPTAPAYIPERHSTRAGR